MNDNGNDVNKSTAPGQLKGYLLQVYFAFYELCVVQDSETIVSIEKLDDVSTETFDETQLSQLKSSTSSNNPLCDSSLDFWKAIYNWCVYSNDANKYKYVVISSKELTVGDVIYSINESKNEESAMKAYNLMVKSLGERDNKDKAFLKHKNYLMDSCNKDLIIKVFMNLSIEQINNSFLSKMHKAFFEKCINDKDYMEFEKYMLGWVNEIIIELLEKGKTIEIKTIDFNKTLNTCMRKYRGLDLKFDDTYSDKDILKILDEKPNYIRQLDLIEVDDDEKRDAAINFSLETKNFSQWISDFDVLKDDYQAYKESIIDEYKGIRDYVRDEFNDDIIIGKRIYHTMNKDCPSRVKLNGIEMKPKIVRGTIQVLSNELALGWHPNYINKIKKGD